MRRVFRTALFLATMAIVAGVAAIPLAFADEDDKTDELRKGPTLCNTGGLPVGVPFSGVGLPFSLPRAAKNIDWVANRCGPVGTDVEFQTRWHDHGGGVSHRHDYAFVGTMGFGFQIFDITIPNNPVSAGGYVDSGWQNDIQLRGNIAASTFDGVSGEDSTASTCLKDPANRAPGYAANAGQGVDLFYTNWSLSTAKYTPRLLDCAPNPPGGAHNSTLHPSGRWIAISNPSSDWAVDIVDLRGIWSGNPVHRFRLIDATRADTSVTNSPPVAPAGDPAERCNPTTDPPGPATSESGTFKCLIMMRPPPGSLGSDPATVPSPPNPGGSGCANKAPTTACNLWRPHDVHFSADGNTMYVAALNSTFIVDVSPINQYMNNQRSFASVTTAPTISIIPNGETAVQLSHQADVSVDGKMLAIWDEKGGGTSNLSCNEEKGGLRGGIHFYALATIGTVNGTPSNPKLLGSYFNPNSSDLPVIDNVPGLGELKRGCTTHIGRLGGNGSMSPGSPQFEGMSRLPNYQMMTAWYGAGTWWIDFSGPARDNDGQAEFRCPLVNPPPSCRNTTWGNTLGYNVQLGADTWSAKEYRGHIYTGDIVRGFDVFKCTNGCPQVFRDPVVTLTKTGPATARRGETIEYTLTYTNAGPFSAGNSKVTDTLPWTLGFVSGSHGATYNSSTRQVTWNLGTVPAGIGGTLKLRVTVSRWAPLNSTIVNKATYTGVQVVSPPTATAATTILP
ncbi:MAG: hypothetical protein ABR583_09265 [Gaiellaceae bacterium]